MPGSMLGYLTGALGYLPLSPAFALSTALQKRVLQYLLRAALGRLIRDGDLKLDQIDSEISSGRIEIRNVHLDVQYINGFLAHTGIQARYGLVGSISISIPWSNLLGGDISIALTGLDVECSAGVTHTSTSKVTESLGESLLSAAEDAMEEDEEGKLLEESVASLMAESGAVEGEAQGGGLGVFMTRQLNSLVARTTLSVSNVLLRMRNTGSEAKEDIEIQFRLDHAKVATVSSDTSDRVTRTLSIEGFSLWINAGEVNPTAGTEDESVSSSSSATPEWEREDEGVDQSMAASVYASAMGLDSVYQQQGNVEARSVLREKGPQVIARFGERPIVVALTSYNSAADPAADRTSSQKPALSIDCDAVVSLISPYSAGALLRFTTDSSAILARMHANNASNSPSPAPKSSTAQDEVRFELNVKHVHLVAMYGFPGRLEEKDYEAYRQTCQAFWSRPSRSSPRIGHIRLRAFQVKAVALFAALTTSLSTSVGDLALYEHLVKREASGLADAQIAPILILDPNLTSSSAHTRGGQHSCMVDWRNEQANADRPNPYSRTDFSDHGWKLKSGAGKGKESLQGRAAIEMHLHTGATITPLAVDIIPLHLFFETSTVERLLPLLHHLGTSVQDTVQHSEQLSASAHTLRASTFSIVEPIQEPQSETRSLPFILRCPMFRLEIRASRDAHVVGNIGDTRGDQTRSGTTAVDLYDVRLIRESTRSILSTHPGPPRQPAVRFPEDELDRSAGLGAMQSTSESMKVALSLSRIKLNHLPSNAIAEIPFASFAPLQSSDQAEAAVLPTFSYSEASKEAINTSSSFECVLPSAQVELSKPLLDNLELLADDCSLWIGRIREWHQQTYAKRTRDALRILGSRFFGSRYSYSTLSGSSTSTELGRERGQNVPTLDVLVHEVTVTVRLPALDESKGNDDQAALIWTAVEVKMLFDAAYSENCSSLQLSAGVLTLRLAHRPEPILQQTLRNSLQQAQRPMLTVQIVTTSEPDTSFRGSQINIAARNFTVTFDGDLSVLYQLKAFVKAPEGVFEHVEPNEVTRVALSVEDATLLLAPSQKSSRAAVVVGDLMLKTKIISDYPRSAIRMTLKDAGVYVGEKLLPRSDTELRARRASELWVTAGLVRMVQMSDLEAIATSSSFTLPEIDVQVTKGHLEAFACADTPKIVPDIFAVFDQLSSSSPGPEARRDSEEVRESTVVMHDIEDDTYVQTHDLSSDLDLLDDDLPYHLGSYGKRPADTVERGRTILQNDLVTVRLLDVEKGISPQMGYFSNPDLHVARPSDGAGQRAPNMRLTVRDVDVTVHMHAGFDFESTRKAIEEEAKRVRRRLLRIKQLLDQGQTPDDSVEEATATLFDSIHVSLPKGRSAGDMNAAELMQMVDDELDDQTETASTASTWKQFVPGRVGSPSLASSKRKRSKLARSKDSMIEFELKDVQLDYDMFDVDAKVRSKLLARVRSIRVLDHIKTSTWQTFLTGMASGTADLAGRAADMVRVELVNVRSPSRGDDEIRCKMRLSPLRLHVDQDALDFMKKFFMLEVPGEGGRDRPSGGGGASLGPFIQHAEVYPIVLKLDYKPKRVDYRLLRQGKTIEMMNFFNFEGSEITLRHITLRGIMGWPLLFDTLNDMWTPDVKSNQLADVLSGITPIRSLVNVGNGVADLILLPIEHYQRDGRLGRGLREGAKRFVKTTALEAVRIGARLATGTQVILERTEHVLGGGARRMEEQHGVVTDEGGGTDEFDDGESGTEGSGGGGVEPGRISRYASRPENLRQALDEAQRGFSRGLNEAAQTILAVPMEVYDRQAGEGRGKPVIRAVPIAVLRGASGASEAVSKTLQGIERELGGAQRAEYEQREGKYKRPANEIRRG